MTLDPTTLLFGLITLLLPVAAISGWYAGRKTRGQQQSGLRDRFTRDYFKGLNFLLNEQDDKAIEVFVGLMEVDNDTVETHLAIGNLFRRRGEVDRALRIHQNLVARPNLHRDHRQHALYELARDYLAAGLFDRAEALLKELIEGGSFQREALKRLLTIYERQQDWQVAIATAIRLEAAANEKMDSNIAHYHCELAESKLRLGDRRAANTHFKQALGVDSHCVRASLRLGDLAFDGGDYRNASKHYRRSLEQNPEFIPEAIQRLLRCYRKLDKIPELEQMLQGLAKEYHGLAPFLVLAALDYEKGDSRAAEQHLDRYISNTPDLQGLSRIYYTLFGGNQPPPQDGQLVQRLRDAHTSMLEMSPAYQCQRCGFESVALYWQCPSCHTWSGVTPSPHGPMQLTSPAN